MGHLLLTDVLLLLAGSIPVVLLLRRVHVPPIAGLLVVGALLGPGALGWIHAREEVEALAELGVALLLFTVGLEFSLPRLLLMRRRIVLGGGGQVLLTTLVVTGALLAWGIAWRPALALAFLAMLSSTAIALKLLHDTRSVDAPHGQLSVAILLTQDLAVIPILLVVPLLAGAGTGPEAALLALGKGVVGVAAVLLLARHGFSRVAAVVVRAGGRELFTLFIVTVALGAAWITHLLDLPLALGTFVAGLVISESEYSHQVVDEILPFRDVFSALFFMSIGMLFDVGYVTREPWTILGLVLALAAVKGGVVFGLGWWLTRSGRVALLTAAALFQVGEFAFVVAAEARDADLLAPLHEQRFLAVAVITMLCTPFAMAAAPGVARRLFGGETGTAERGAPDEALDVLVAGFGLTGRHLHQVLSATGIPHRVIELNPDTVRTERFAGTPILQGDVSRRDVLLHAGLRSARVLVVAINDPAATRRAVALARRTAPEVQIVVRSRYLNETEELLRLGATHVVPEEFETSVQIFSHVLRELHVPRGSITIQAELIRREGYQLLRGRVPEDRNLEVVHEILAHTAVDTLFVPASASAAGRTLAELDVRDRTGATVLSVVREGAEIHLPGADFRLEPHDLLVVMGNHEQLDGARDLLAGKPTESPG